jgi:hypothetical protein
MEEYNLEEIENLSLEEQEKLFQKMLDEQSRSLDLSKLNLEVASQIISKEDSIKIDNGEVIHYDVKNKVNDIKEDEDDRFNQKILEYENKILELRQSTIKNDSQKVSENEINEAFKKIDLKKLNQNNLEKEEIVTLDSLSYEEILNSKLPSFIKEKVLENRKIEAPKNLKKEIVPIYEQLENVETSKHLHDLSKENILKIVNNSLSVNNKKMLNVIGKIIKDNNEKLEKKFNEIIIKEINKILLDFIKNK